MLALGARPADLGLLAAMSTGPAIVVGLIAGGWLGGAFGPRSTLIAAALGLTAAGLLAFASPLRLYRDATSEGLEAS